MPNSLYEQCMVRVDCHMSLYKLFSQCSHSIKFHFAKEMHFGLSTSSNSAMRLALTTVSVIVLAVLFLQALSVSPFPIVAARKVYSTPPAGRLPAPSSFAQRYGMAQLLPRAEYARPKTVPVALLQRSSRDHGSPRAWPCLAGATLVGAVVSATSAGRTRRLCAVEGDAGPEGQEEEEDDEEAAPTAESGKLEREGTPSGTAESTPVLPDLQNPENLGN